MTSPKMVASHKLVITENIESFQPWKVNQDGCSVDITSASIVKVICEFETFQCFL